MDLCLIWMRCVGGRRTAATLTIQQSHDGDVFFTVEPELIGFLQPRETQATFVTLSRCFFQPPGVEC